MFVSDLPAADQATDIASIVAEELSGAAQSTPSGSTLVEFTPLRDRDPASVPSDADGATPDTGKGKPGKIWVIIYP